MIKDHPQCRTKVVVWQPAPRDSGGLDIAGLELVGGEKLPPNAHHLHLTSRETTALIALRLFGWPGSTDKKGVWVGGEEVKFELKGPLTVPLKARGLNDDVLNKMRQSMA